MHNLFPLEKKLADDWTPDAWRDLTIVVAISGGADSCALLRALQRLKQGRGQGRLIAAHYNHALRAKESDDDERFVRALCEEHGITLRVGRFDGDWSNVTDANEGLEAAARELRHAFLLDTAQADGARNIVTAHTADDQVETILHRIVRGTAIAGLSGIPRTREVSPGIALIRPMLSVRRAEVIAYLDAIDQPFREDSSNRESRFTRNRIRHELVPMLLERFNPSADEAILRLGHLAEEASAAINASVDILATSALQYDADHATVLREPTLGASPYVVRELFMRIWKERRWPLRAMGYAEWQELAAMLTGNTGDAKRVFPGNIAVEPFDAGLRLTRSEANRDA